MTGVWRGFVLFACLGLGGCAWFGPDRSTIVEALRPSSKVEAGMIQIDAHLIQRPLGDDFIDREIWNQTDPLTVPLAKKEILEMNGLRVGHVVGLAPSKLQELARSPRWCLDPRRRGVPSGESFRQVLSPILRDCPVEVVTAGKTDTLSFDQAKFLLEVTASVTKDNRTLLKFTPKVETGESQTPFMPSASDGTWKLSLERHTKSLPELSWEVTLAPNDVLIIGGDAGKEKTVGQRAFIEDRDDGPVQRLLVLRTTRTQSNDSETPTLEDLARMPSAAEMAAQVGMPAVRASGK